MNLAPRPGSMTSRAQRLGKNINGYFGETVEMEPVMLECAAAAAGNGWMVEELPAPPKPTLLAFVRPAPNSVKNPLRIYVSAGIHGDEPAGPLAIRGLLRDDLFPPDVSFWVCPCLNPTGFALKQRENAEGTDLNRHYLQPKAEEIVAHVRWLERQPSFDLCLCLHEDWESQGFYLYELNPDHRPSLAEQIIRQVAAACPVDYSEVIEGREAHGGIIRPDIDVQTRPQWPEAFYLLTHKTRLSYTFEAPSDFPLHTRVSSLVAATHAAIKALRN